MLSKETEDLYIDHCKRLLKEIRNSKQIIRHPVFMDQNHPIKISVVPQMI